MVKIILFGLIAAAAEILRSGEWFQESGRGQVERDVSAAVPGAVDAQRGVSGQPGAANPLDLRGELRGGQCQCDSAPRPQPGGVWRRLAGRLHVHGQRAAD